ncbi:MAG TPA: arginine repressor [Clostridia bacterium]|nr:arginine repressor [Clostridia bacterium]
MKKIPKRHRQSRILQLIGERNIETQSDLVDALKLIDVFVTQATVSRDITELGIVKVTTGEGRQKYVALAHSGEVAAGRMKRVFAEAVTLISRSDSLVIIKTLPGMAQGAASALDSMYLDEIIGTLAGDDTIFIATHDRETAERLQFKLDSSIKTDEVEITTESDDEHDSAR